MSAHFPPEIYVTRSGEPDDDDTYLNARESADHLDDDIEDGERCAVYQLVRVGRVNVSREFVEDAP